MRGGIGKRGRGKLRLLKNEIRSELSLSHTLKTRMDEVMQLNR